MSRYRLTIRQGPRVTREQFEDLDAAIEALERRAKEIRSAGPLKERKMLREFEPGGRVAARFELSTGGWLRNRTAGIDVMGDGRAVPYAGAVARSELEPREGESIFDAVRRELTD